ncbi:CehA/McbA family metallohydrolase [Breznakiella homolactica]|uniref:CehA/McbA family metallohydrolase n=1 Tax=Breznakiella homolactica TaxID=2798577 RepID=A0A7T8BA41_9SPIR|nr:CehA/McbA family metallohydrolase [Breznakiella homolactica]QQO09137.1 CehA/McbA family metallohydrolase [Breznakiella homolactica]
MITYKAFELHTHTLNSDGRFTPEELCRSAAAFLYDGIALTDHNTMAGLDHITPKLMSETVPVIPGIEWTTFFGHMVVLGADRYVDWRFAVPDTIDTYLAQIKEARGVAGIAHPFSVGSPMCTGCHWDFNVGNWENVSYIEVWSEPFPHSEFKNDLAFRWWTDLLNQGHRLAATSGRDWHGPDKRDVLTTATYLGLEEGQITSETVKDALRGGRSFVTCGPLLNFLVTEGDSSYGPGETVSPGEYTIFAAADESRRRSVWERFNIKTREIAVVHNGETAARITCDGSGGGDVAVALSEGWVRAEVYGDYLEEKNKLLAFSSPVYVR